MNKPIYDDTLAPDKEPGPMPGLLPVHTPAPQHLYGHRHPRQMPLAMRQDKALPKYAFPTPTPGKRISLDITDDWLRTLGRRFVEASSEHSPPLVVINIEGPGWSMAYGDAEWADVEASYQEVQDFVVRARRLGWTFRMGMFACPVAIRSESREKQLQLQRWQQQMSARSRDQDGYDAQGLLDVMDVSCPALYCFTEKDLHRVGQWVVNDEQQWRRPGNDVIAYVSHQYIFGGQMTPEQWRSYLATILDSPSVDGVVWFTWKNNNDQPIQPYYDAIKDLI